MSDKELLELAAKAVGLKFHAYVDSEIFGSGINTGELDTPLWNPLADDGDALRLAVKLGMELTLPARRLEVSGASVWFDGKLIHHMIWMGEDADESDFMDAARRNIVAVATDVGKAMP